jgi:hypothetical protein
LVAITRALPVRLGLREDDRPFDDDAMTGSSPSKPTWQLSRRSEARTNAVEPSHDATGMSRSRRASLRKDGIIVSGMKAAWVGFP